MPNITPLEYKPPEQKPIHEHKVPSEYNTPMKISNPAKNKVRSEFKFQPLYLCKIGKYAKSHRKSMLSGQF